MKAALVGNGPSAGRYGEEIDRTEFVVRMSNWIHYFPDWSAGRKCSAWAGPFYPKDNKQVPPGRGWEMWMTCPLEWHKGKKRFRNAERIAAPRGSIIRVCPLAAYTRLRQHLQSSAGRSLPPSTGILAVAMALPLAEFSRITLYGFDAGLSNACRYANGRKGRFNLHPFAAEAMLLGGLENGTWMGDPVSKEVVWRRP